MNGDPYQDDVLRSLRVAAGKIPTYAASQGSNNKKMVIGGDFENRMQHQINPSSVSPLTMRRYTVLDAITQIIYKERSDRNNAPSSKSSSTNNKKNKETKEECPTATEYFAAIMTALESSAISLTQSANSSSSNSNNSDEKDEDMDMENEEQNKNNDNDNFISELIYLLSVVISKVSPAVLRAKMDTCLQILVGVLTMFVSGNWKSAFKDETSFAMHGFECLGVLLSIVEPSKEAWSRPAIIKPFDFMLRSCFESKAKVRKAIQSSLVNVIHTTIQAKCSTPTKHAVTYCISLLRETDVAHAQRSLQVIQFLRQFIGMLYKIKGSTLSNVIDEILRISSLGHKELSMFSMQAIVDFLQSERDIGEYEEDSKSTKILEVILEIIIEDSFRRTFQVDAAMTAAWISLVELTFLRFMDANEASNGNVNITAFPEVIRSLVSILNIEGMAAQTSKALSSVIKRVTVLMIADKLQSDSEIEKMIHHIQVIISPQLMHTWHFSLPVYSLLFRQFALAGNKKVHLLTPSLKKLVTVRESIVNPITGEEIVESDGAKIWLPEIEKFFGSAITSLGASKFLEAVPLTSESDNHKVLAGNRVWLIPVLRQYLKYTKTELNYFQNEIMKLAKSCDESSKEPGIGKATAKTYKMRCAQLWSLFPSFCSRASDIAAPNGFKSIARVLAAAIEDTRYPELTGIVCNGLCIIIDENLVCAGLPGLTNNFEENDKDDEEDDDEEENNKQKKDEDEEDESEDENDEDNDNDDDEDESVAKSHKKSVASSTTSKINIYTMSEAEANLSVLRGFAKNFLPLLFNQYDKAVHAATLSTGLSNMNSEQAQSIFNAISAYGHLAETEYLSTLFRQIQQKLLLELEKQKQEGEEEMENGESGKKKSNNGSSLQTHILTALSIALIPSLDDASISILFRVLQPRIQDDKDHTLQKRAYRALLMVCKTHPAWVKENEQELMKLLKLSLVVVSASAKTARLKCLRYIIRVHRKDVFESNNKEQFNLSLAELLGEVIICTKETNSKARNAAYQLLTEIADLLDALDRENGLKEYLQMIIAGLAARTPHTRSATIIALCRAFTDFGSRPEIQDIIPDVSRTALMCLQEKSREVAKSAITFCKICIARIPINTLREFYADIIQGLLPWSLDSKNRFSLMIRVVFERMIKKLGFKAIEETNLIPEDHRLYLYLKKQMAYKSRKQEREEASGGRNRRMEQGGDDEENDDDDDSLDFDNRSRKGKRRIDGSRKSVVSAGTSKSKGTAFSLKSKGSTKSNFVIRETTDGPIDLLDASTLGNVKNSLLAQARKHHKKNDDFEMRDGKIVIPNDENGESSNKSGKNAFASIRDDEYEDEHEDVTKNKAGFHSQKSAKRRKTERGEIGAEFKSKKAGGDVKKKGSSVEPYAYVPLERRMLGRHNKRMTKSTFQSLVKHGKRGAGNQQEKGHRRR